MTATSTNGQPLHEGAKYPSPFTNLVALGWYDGPTNGLIQAGDRVWKFDMVDEIHNPDGLDLRIFALAPLPTDARDRLVTALGQHQTVTSPIWTPRWQFPTDADREAMDRLTAEVLRQAGPVEWIVAAEDLVEEIVASRAAPAADVHGVNDWLSFLDLNRWPAQSGRKGG